jgi:hypothetical protein
MRAHKLAARSSSARVNYRARRRARRNAAAQRPMSSNAHMFGQTKLKHASIKFCLNLIAPFRVHGYSAFVFGGG